jgi:hypothetical protein
MISSLDALLSLNYAHKMGCAVHSAGRFTPIARRVWLRPTTRFAGFVPMVYASLNRLALGYCSAVHRPYPGRSDQTGALPVNFRYVTLLNVAPKAGCRASFASSLSRRAGQAPHQLTVLGHLNGWGRFTQAAPPAFRQSSWGFDVPTGD